MLFVSNLVEKARPNVLFVQKHKFYIFDCISFVKNLLNML